MAKVYADLIKKGLKSLDDVPIKLRDAIKVILEGDVDAQIFIFVILKEGGGRNGSCLCNTNCEGQKDF